MFEGRQGPLHGSKVQPPLMFDPMQADRDTAAWEAEQLRVRNAELDTQLAAAQAEADEQRAAKDDAQAALARARSRIEDLTEEVKPQRLRFCRHMRSYLQAWRSARVAAHPS